MMNRTNRSIAALFILTTLAVQPVAMNAMASRVAQAAKQGFNAAKQFAYHDLGGKAKTAAKTTALLSPVGYVIADPLHGGSVFNVETGTYAPSARTILRAVDIGCEAVVLTWATGVIARSTSTIARLAANTNIMQSIPSTKSRFIGIALALAAKAWISRSSNTALRDIELDFMMKNPHCIFSSQPGFSWDKWAKAHLVCVAHKDNKLK